MAETTDILHACESIGYRRKAHRILDALEDAGLISTRIDDSQNDSSAKKSPRVAMLTTRGERFVEEHEAELATADMDCDDLREEVYELREELEAVEDRVADRQDEIEERLDDVGRERVAALRSDVQQLEDRVSAIEGKLANVPSGDEISRLRRDVQDDIDSVRADFGEQVRKINVRIGDVATDVGALERAVDDLDAWQDEAEQRWHEDIQPWLSYWYDHADELKTVLTR